MSGHETKSFQDTLGQKLPPSGRDFDVFSAVILEGKSTREAAGQFHLSQTRICQIVEKMRHWQAEAVPAEATVPDERLLRLAKEVAAMRLDHLYCEMMEAWRRSQGEVKKTRCSRYGDDVTTTFNSCGDPKYLLAALRISRARAELPAGLGYIVPPDVEDDDSIARQSTGRPEARPTMDHSAGDCSEFRRPRPAAAPAERRPASATATQQTACAELTPRQAAARDELFHPVQPKSPAGGERIAQLQITPEQLGLSVEGILAGQQRRKDKRARRAG